MTGMITSSLDSINTLPKALQYTNLLVSTRGKKNFSAVARENDRSHDAVLRNLNFIAEHPEEIRKHLLKNAVELNKQRMGFLIIDHTHLLKEHAKKWKECLGSIQEQTEYNRALVVQ